MKLEKLDYKKRKSYKMFLYSFIIGVLLLFILIKSSNQEESLSATNLTEENNLIGIFIKEEKDSSYTRIKTIPTEGYILNETESYCKTPTNESEKINNIINYDNETQTLTVKSLNDIHTKCFLYFDKQSPSEQTMHKLGFDGQYSTINQLTGPSCKSGCDNQSYPNMNQNGIYQAEDDYGTSYYFRGTVDNNWVKFAGYYWRIIRINGNGTIRLIYSGSTTNATNSDTQLKNAAFNFRYNDDNKYVGLMYGGKNNTRSTSYETAHVNETANNVLEDSLIPFYNGIKNTYGQYIDEETGFCGDRSKSTHTRYNYPDLGYSTYGTVYGPGDRLWKSTATGYDSIQEATLKCNNPQRDLYTTKEHQGIGNGTLPVPVGLITSDEVIYAGGYGDCNNWGYYLYNSKDFWTMSPAYYISAASVFCINTNGKIVNSEVDRSSGVRPVINLKSNITFIEGGNGTTEYPFEVETT